MNKKALFIIPPERFNEDELFQPKAALEQAGVNVTIASTTTGEITGDFQGKATAEVIFSDVSATDYDVVAVIGGSGTNDYLWDNQKLQQYLKQAHQDRVLVSGICAGTVTVARTGLLTDREATCYPLDIQIDQLKANHVTYIAQHVVVHNDIITADGPDGAAQFGASLVQALN